MGWTSAAYEHRAPEAIGAARPERFDELYRLYHPRLLALCKRKVGQDALAEDIAQETLVRALTHLDDFDGRRPLWPWLKTIATNLIVDHFRKHAREVFAEAEDGQVEDDASSVEEADLLRRAIGMLPRRQRAAVALRYVNDWDAHDAANFMGLTRPAYEQLLFRARRRLKAEYHRLLQEVSSGLLLGTAGLRALLRRASNRVREIQASVPSLGELASVSATHFVSGAVVLAMSLGAHVAPLPSPDDALASATAGRRGAAAPAEGKQRREPAPRGDRARVARPGSAAAGGVASTTTGGTDKEGARGDLLGSMTSQDVDDPEDAQITSVAVASGTGEDRTMFIGGRGECPTTLCPAVLFRSDDSGRSWRRLPATGFEGSALMLPPAFGSGDERIFAMGRTGLQVSRDAGATFTQASPSGPNYMVGTAAMSPAFSDGDPSILIGAQTMMRYRDDLGAVEPITWTTGTGPLYPAYAPAYPSDDRVLVGGLFPAADGTLASAVHVCSSTSCSTTHLGQLTIHPRVRVAPDFASSDLVYAFTDETIYMSADGALSFEETESGWDRALVRDVAVAPSGRLFVAVQFENTGGLYYSDDRGTTWTRADSPLFDHGASTIAVSGDFVVAGLARTGLACSTDGGVTWGSRCGA